MFFYLVLYVSDTQRDTQMEYLSKNRYGLYRIRIRPPMELKNYFQKSELLKSLKTKCYKEAVNKATATISQYKKLLDVVRMGMLTDIQIKELCDKFIKDNLEEDRKDRVATGYGSIITSSKGYPDYATSARDALSDIISDFKQDLANSEFKNIVNTAKELLDTIGIEYNPEDISHKLLLQGLMRANIEVLEEAYNRYLGKYSTKYDYADTTVNHATTAEPNKPIFTVEKALKEFLRWHSNTSASDDQKRDVSNFLQDIFLNLIEDKNEDVNNITSEDMVDLYDVLLEFPKRDTEAKKRMSLDELLQLDVGKDEIISARTRAKYCKWIIMFFGYLLDNGHIVRNPAKRLPTTVSSNEQEERLPLSNDEIAKLFELLDGDKVVLNTLKVFAYSGMRLSELYKAKIAEIDGVLCFDLRGKDEKLKTKSSYRIVPIHSSIDTKLLDNLPSKAVFSRKINNLIREHISQDDRKVLYSLRHSFATTLKNKMIQPEVISEILGHSHTGITLKRYASSYDVNILKGAIEKLEF